MFSPEQILERKSTLFSIVVSVVVGILAIPVILPHLFHGYHIIHIMLHIGGVTLASFLTVLGVLAYIRLQTRRLLFTAIAFGIFILAEVITLLEATWPSLYSLASVSLLEVGHLLMITSLGLLAIGVFRND